MSQMAIEMIAMVVVAAVAVPGLVFCFRNHTDPQVEQRLDLYGR